MKILCKPSPRLSRKLNAFVPEVAAEVVKCCFLLICRVNKRREARLREYLRSVTICRGFYDGRRGTSGVETNGKMKGEFEDGEIGTMLYDDGQVL